MRKTIILLIVFTLTSLNLYAQNSSFTFPEVSNEGQIMSIGSRLNQMQVPEDVLNKMSTIELLDICLDFPYIIDIFFYDNLQKGYENLKKEFNGYEELTKRSDVEEVILNKYGNLHKEIECVNNLSQIEQGEFSIKWFVFEMMISQDWFLNNLNQNKEKDLLATCIRNKQIKENNQHIFSSVNEIPTHLLLIKKALHDPEVYQIDEDNKKELIEFVKRPFALNDTIIQSVQVFSQMNDNYEK